MGNEESKMKSNDKKYKTHHHDEISDYYASEEHESKRHCKRSSSRKRSKTSTEVSKSWSRSPGRGRRTMSQSPKRSYGRLEKKEIEPLYTDYYCKDCDCYSSGKISWKQHIVGRRHAKNTEREMPELYESKKRKLIETETRNRLHDYVPKEKLRKESVTDYMCNKKSKFSDNVSQNLTETNQNNFVGLEYILVIHRPGKSVFQCFLCDTYTFYKNSQQLKDHILGVDHQKAYEEEKHKSSIKIKRLKSKNSGKRALEELVEQKLFSSNTAERIAKKSTDIPRDSRPHKDSKSKPKSNNFLRKTIEEVQLHNRKYELKMTSTTFQPEWKLSTPASESVFSKNSSPSRCTTASPGCGSPVSFSSFNDIASLGNGISSPVPSSKSAQTFCLLELVETLSTIDIFKLLLLKLKNVKIQEQDLPFLDEVAEETMTLSKKFKKQDFTLQKKNVEMQEDLIFIDEVADKNTALPKQFKKQLDSTLQKENLDEQETSIPLFIEVGKDCNSEKDITAVQNATLQVSTKVPEESSTSSAIMDQLDQAIQPPAAFWTSLPSTKDLENILSNLPSLNLCKNSDGVVQINLT